MTEKDIMDAGWKEGGFYKIADKLVPSFYEESFPNGTYPFKIHFLEQYDYVVIQGFHSDGIEYFRGRVHDIETLKVLIHICKHGLLAQSGLECPPVTGKIVGSNPT